MLFIAFGAVVNAIYLALGTDYYADFADASPFPFVRNTWQSLVVLNTGLFIGLLIIFEAVVGALILSGGGRTQPGLLALIGFHIGQLAFGGVLWPWATVMLVALVLLLRAERHPPTTHQASAPKPEAANWRHAQTRRKEMWRTALGVLLVAHGLLTIRRRTCSCRSSCPSG